jgi:hypothetical protein
MLFTFNDRKYILQFEYVNYPDGERLTYSEFYYRQEGTREKVVLGHGTSYCSPKDDFVRFMGRKIAVKRLLENVQENGFFDDNPKEFRTEFWNQYFEQVKNK